MEESGGRGTEEQVDIVFEGRLHVLASSHVRRLSCVSVGEFSRVSWSFLGEDLECIYPTGMCRKAEFACAYHRQC